VTLGRGRSHLDRQLRGRRHLPETIGWAVAVIVSVLSVWLRSAIPLLSGGGSVDDFLFLRSAGYLAHGQWLGPFDQYHRQSNRTRSRERSDSSDRRTDIVIAWPIAAWVSSASP